jgi:TolB-like protein
MFDMSDNRAYLVPVVVDSTPESAADVPEQFFKAQFSRLTGGVPTSGFVDNVKRLLRAPGASGAGAAPASVTPQLSNCSGADSKSIAVLPFVNWSTDAEQGFFADGLSEELLNLLAKIPTLQVTSRSSAFSYKGKEIKIAQVARELNVANILEGSVRRSGNRLRITAQLIDARTDRHLWSGTYDRTMDDIFAVQDEIAGAVVEQLKITLLGAAPKAKAFDPKAYPLFLQARELLRALTEEGLAQAVSLFKRVLEIDPTLAAAWDGLAACYADQADSGLRPSVEGYGMAFDAANKALAIDPNLAIAHARLAQLASASGSGMAVAAGHLEHALKLEPTNIEIVYEAVTMARFLGRLEMSVSLAEYCVMHDPVNPMALGRLGGGLIRAGRYDEAIEPLLTSLRLTPGRIQVHMNLSTIHLMKGEFQEALSEAQLEPAVMWRLVTLVTVYHALGMKAESDSALAELIQKCETDASWNIAYTFAYRGEADLAFEWLEQAIAYKDAGLADTPWTWQFKPIMSDPRWMPFLRKIGRAPEQLAAIKFEVNLPAR